VQVERLEDAAFFLAEAEPLLLTDEARHNLILGIAGTIRDSPGHYQTCDLGLVRDGGDAVAAALRTPPYNLILARPRSPQALDALAAAVAGEDLPGVVGAEPEAVEFAERWTRQTGVPARTSMRQGVYALERIEPLRAVSGVTPPATVEDRELALRWLLAFGDEAFHEGGPGRDHAEVMVDYRLSSPSAGIMLWEDDGEPFASPAGAGRPRTASASAPSTRRPSCAAAGTRPR
jgi:hypothetical protein